MKTDVTTERFDGQFQKLKALRDHLISMDSGSGDAAVLTWAIGTIEKLAVSLGQWEMSDDTRF